MQECCCSALSCETASGCRKCMGGHECLCCSGQCRRCQNISLAAVRSTQTYSAYLQQPACSVAMTVCNERDRQESEHLAGDSTFLSVLICPSWEMGTLSSCRGASMNSSPLHRACTSHRACQGLHKTPHLSHPWACMGCQPCVCKALYYNLNSNWASCPRLMLRLPRSADMLQEVME